MALCKVTESNHVFTCIVKYFYWPGYVLLISEMSENIDDTWVSVRKDPGTRVKEDVQQGMAMCDSTSVWLERKLCQVKSLGGSRPHFLHGWPWMLSLLPFLTPPSNYLSIAIPLVQLSDII